MDEEIVAEIERVRSFWIDFGEEILDQLSKDIPICTHYSAQCGIVLEQVRYKKRGMDKIHTKWLRKSLGKSKFTVCKCIWQFYPVEIVPGKICPHDLKKAVYCYNMSVIKYDRSKPTITEHCKIITLWDGTLVKKEIRLKEETAEFPYKFAFPKRYIARTNQFLEKNYLPQLWAGGNCAFWHLVGRSGPFYMGTLNVSTEGFSDEVEHLKEICNISAGAVLVAYTCFSILKPFFSSYHQLDRRSPYLQVKKHIEDLVAVNIWGRRPEDSEKLVKCCCGYFDLDAKRIVGSVIDGINIINDAAKGPKLSEDEHERSILQPACVLWLNRVPTEELTVNGRIIDLQIDDRPFGEEVADISRYLVSCMAGSFSEYMRTKGLDVTCSLKERKKLVVKDLVDRIEALAKEHSISLPLDNVDLKELHKVTGSEKYSFTVKCAKRYVFSIKCSMPDYMGATFGMELSKLNSDRALRQRLDRLLLRFKKELKYLYDIDSPTKYHHQNAIRDFRRNSLTRGLDKHIIRKIAYLSASFRIFAALCLPEEDQKLLIEKVDGALITTIVKQVGQECAQDILEGYLTCFIESGQYARIRGTHKNGKDIAVWYDPIHDIFLLPAGTYFLQIKGRFDVKITKSHFEDALVQAGIISETSRRTSEREQRRRTFERVLEPGGKKVSVLQILRGKLSDRFTENDLVQQAIKEMSSDPTSFRSREG